ncbi:hypothetical protein MB46_03420 [Arthrobacter alpinus]|uniref:hypothetical protein n=1 Tax=Arthrobacter alpinus TaxID=656366 RepID=UPI0005C99AAF|nr:hypothetical protein [Arthrobacter alpinus]ALV44701.1 hypothetical protein MB46_03420 [Arthrobacter alpinus]
MGAQNVAKVFVYWRQLDHREARALLYMANTALDKDDPPVYFAGWEAIASALGQDPDSSPDAAKRAAMRSLKALRLAGAVVSSGQARMNVRSEYALALDPKVTFVPSGSGRGIGWAKVQRVNRGTPAVTQQGDTQGTPAKTLDVTQQGDAHGKNRGTPGVTPMRTEEPLGGIPRGIPIIHSSSLTNAGETEPSGETSFEDERERQSKALRRLMKEEESA